MLEEIDELATTLLTSEYASTRPDLVALYERSKGRQWDAVTDLPWDTIVAPGERIIDERMLSLYGTPEWEAMSPIQRADYHRRELAWVISQFMHAEQASLVACGQLMAALPELDAKFYAASQGYDEARHLDVYRRYLDEKLELAYPIDVHVQFICRTALGATDWGMKLVSIQMTLETLAMGAFKTLHDAAVEPLLRQILAYITQDEARHVAFGRLALAKALRECTTEKRDGYEDFLAGCAHVIYDGFFPEPVFRDIGLTDMVALRKSVSASAQRALFRTDLFSVLLPNAVSVGLVTDRTRARYEALGLSLEPA